MRKAKTRSPKKTRPAPKKKMDSVPALKERLEAEFAQAVKSAKWYVDEPQRLRSLFEKATQEAAKLPKHQFKDTWPYFQAMLRLIQAYYRSQYRDVSESTLVVIVAAIIYVVNPLDIIPDAMPALGYLDDATVLALAVRRTRQTLDDFMMWETTAA